MNSPSPVLIVAFGGLAFSTSGTPPFEFFRMLNRHAPTKKVLIRDHRQAWYHRGLRDFGEDIAGIAAELGRAIADADASRVVMLGSSAGGYAALLFGRLLGATEVHAFGPQTFISPELRQRHGDDRFGEPLSALMSSGRYQSRYGDLDSLFRRTPADGTRFTIHYCEAEPLDAAHARHLSSHPEVELRGYAQGGHNFIKHLRNTGELQPIIEQMIGA